MRKTLITLLFLFIGASFAFAQADEVNKNLRLFAHGRIDEVKNNIPNLIAEYPNDPGVKLLLGVVLDDAGKALKLYEEIINDHQKSQWADDAYWRIVQYYAVLGDTAKARFELEKFRRRYPVSEFLAPATDVVRSAVGMAKSGKTAPAELAGASAANDDEMNNEEPTTEEIVEEALDNEVRDQEIAEEATNDEDENKARVLTVEDEVKKDTAAEGETGTAENEEEYSGYYGLQVGIYQNKESAEKERERFLVKRLRTEVKKKNIDGKKMFAVVIGNYTSQESAEAAKMIVKQQCDCDPIIYKKKKKAVEE